MVLWVRSLLQRRSVVVAILMAMAMLPLVIAMESIILGNFALAGVYLGLFLILFGGTLHPERFTRKASLWSDDEEEGDSGLEYFGVFIIALSLVFLFG